MPILGMNEWLFFGIIAVVAILIPTLAKKWISSFWDIKDEWLRKSKESKSKESKQEEESNKQVA